MSSWVLNGEVASKSTIMSNLVSNLVSAFSKAWRITGILGEESKESLLGLRNQE